MLKGRAAGGASSHPEGPGGALQTFIRAHSLGPGPMRQGVVERGLHKGCQAWAFTGDTSRKAHGLQSPPAKASNIEATSRGASGAKVFSYRELRD